MNTRRGAVLPRALGARRPGRAIAAVAVFCFMATTARASVTDFILDPNQSYMKFTVIRILAINNQTGPVLDVPSQPQSVVPSDRSLAPYFGHSLWDVQPSSIKLVGGGLINAAVTGNYSPGENASGAVVPSLMSPGSYALRYPSTGDQERIFNLGMDGVASNPARSTTPIPGNPDGAVSFTLGTTKLVTLFGNSDEVGNLALLTKTSLKNMPVTLTSAAPSLTGTFDPITGKLTIPVASQDQMPFLLHGVGAILLAQGQLVYNRVVPEPSTFVMLVLGSVGLTGVAWRVRKRRLMVNRN